MSVARIIEIKSSSTTSFDNAVREGVAQAVKTLKNVKSAWVQNQDVRVDENGKHRRIPRAIESNLHTGRLAFHQSNSSAKKNFSH